MRDFLRNLRDAALTLAGSADSGARFRTLQRRIHPETLRSHDAILDWAAERARNADDTAQPTNDPITIEGAHLLRDTLAQFSGCLSGTRLRVLVHVPPATLSPAGHSAYSNLARSLDVLGVPTRIQGWDDTPDAIADFRPTVLVTADHAAYLDRIHWPTVDTCAREHPVLVGLTAAPEGQADAPLAARIERAKRIGASFLYAWHAPQALEQPQYDALRETGLPLVSVEFGANVLAYHPEPGIARDIDFALLASSNRSKWERYVTWLAPILRGHVGFVDGPGWRHARRCLMTDAPQAAQRHVYARARVGLNLHIESQLAAPTELNERTYILAACGVPQLVDAPALLHSRFDPNTLYVATSPAEYEAMFNRILKRPEEARERALNAMRNVFARHTTLHRALDFARALESLRAVGPNGGRK
ncbi:hypothetical protein GGQ74_002878 [Desulfobaculum xiamenense]|uniref:Spore protein YkvP/CgeB glycosyl transferase-like domain-containing protein n=1 Tax=Desulfobaculum xiamenense TaxID=995050 RepID=A0A846QM49_9BACT|nr:glycosyltransferase [Desulfobaculum xiamenense]NJB69181.1 hypothetical protein [Desulfobaculum xiamenense]